MSRFRKALKLVASGNVRELTFRAREALRCRSEQAQHRAARSSFSAAAFARIFDAEFVTTYASAEGELAFDAALRAKDRALFYPGFSRVEEFEREVGARWASEGARIVKTADAVLMDRYTVFSLGALSYGSPPSWHRDPLLGREAPIEFYRHIPYLDAEEVGDAKIIWEIARLHFVYDLGQAYLLTRDERYARKFLQLVSSWSDQHADFEGIQFCSALEFAFRVHSLCWGLFFFRDAASLNREAARAIYRMVYLGAEFLESHLSRYFAPNTHLLGEAFGLFLTGLIFPELRSAERWRVKGLEVLEEELDRQFTADGVHAELSTAYHAYATEFVAATISLCRQNGLLLPDVFARRLEQLVDVLRLLQRPDGTWPHVGDEDGGRLLWLTRPNSGDFRPLLEAGNALGVDDPSQHRSCASLETWWLASSGSAADATRRMPAACAEAPSTGGTLAGAGLSIHRSDELGLYSLFQCGDFGYLDSPHSHADMLHLDVSVARDNLLVDPGTYVYTGDLEERNAFRSARAHNGPRLGGLTFMNPNDPFGWLLKPDCRIEADLRGRVGGLTEASYHVRGPSFGRARVFRSVLFLSASAWLVRDRIETTRPVEVQWTFTTPASVELRDGVAVLRGLDGVLHLMPVWGDGVSLEVETRDAWISDDYLDRRPATALDWKATPTTRCEILWLMHPVRPADPLPRLERSSIDQDAFAVDLAVGEDRLTYMARTASARARLDVDTDARLACLVTSADGIGEGMVIDGRRLRIAGRTMLDREAPAALSELPWHDRGSGAAAREPSCAPERGT